jgi:hypothetical protein
MFSKQLLDESGIDQQILAVVSNDLLNDQNMGSPASDELL